MSTEGKEDLEETFVPLDTAGADLRIRWEHYSRFDMERSFAWAIKEDRPMLEAGQAQSSWGPQAYCTWSAIPSMSASSFESVVQLG